MEVNPDWIKMIEGILSGGSTANIIKGILLLLLGVGFFFIKSWIKKQKIKVARAKTQQQRQDHQTQLDQETRVISQDTQNSEERIEDIINGE